MPVSQDVLRSIGNNEIAAGAFGQFFRIREQRFLRYTRLQFEPHQIDRRRNLFDSVDDFWAFHKGDRSFLRFRGDFLSGNLFRAIIQASHCHHHGADSFVLQVSEDMGLGLVDGFNFIEGDIGECRIGGPAAGSEYKSHRCAMLKQFYGNGGAKSTCGPVADISHGINRRAGRPGGDKNMMALKRG